MACNDSISGSLDPSPALSLKKSSLQVSHTTSKCASRMGGAYGADDQSEAYKEAYLHGPLNCARSVSGGVLVEFIMDDYELSTKEILDRFGSDPKQPRTQRFVLKDGEMLCRNGSERTTYTQYFPRYSSVTKFGPLYYEHLQMENGILSFNCYLSEPESQVFCEEQMCRVRPMKLFYYLVDDTISLNEPPVDNSGIMQGRVFTHQKVPRTDKHIGRDFIHWSDLNVAQDIVLFARTYRITSCDQYTKDFLERNGIKVRDAEEIPIDPWTKRRIKKRAESMARSAQSDGFLNCPSKLHLLACWLDRSNDFHGTRQKRTFRMTVFTIDDTVSLVETTPGLEGQVFLKRISLPCKAPSVWVDVYARPMFIYGCEGSETTAFLQQQYGQTDFTDYERVLDEGPPAEHIIEIPTTLKFIAEMLNGPFVAKNFVLAYHVNSGEVDIAESGKQRKWSVGRAFLEGIHSHNYSIDHFAIGNTLTFYRWSFKLLEADSKTLQYLRSKDNRGYEMS